MLEYRVFMTHIKRIDEMQMNNITELSYSSLSTLDFRRLLNKYTEFLIRDSKNIKQNFIDIVMKTYGSSNVKLKPKSFSSGKADPLTLIYLDNKRFYPIAIFDGNYVSRECKDILGQTKKYAIAIDSETRELYLISYNTGTARDFCSSGSMCKKIKSVNVHILSYICEFYIESNIFLEMFRDLGNGDTYGQDRSGVWMVIKSDKSGCQTICGKTFDDVFRDFHDNYNHSFNAWKPHLAAWGIYSQKLESEYNKWLKNADGLKSGLELFYGGGVVD